MTFSAGDVVLVPFPYRDRLAERARPAVVVSADTYNQHGDVVVAAITSHTPRVAMDCALRDWAAAGLKLPSTVRMLLATVASARILFHVGHLTERDWTEAKHDYAWYSRDGRGAGPDLGIKSPGTSCGCMCPWVVSEGGSQCQARSTRASS